MRLFPSFSSRGLQVFPVTGWFGSTLRGRATLFFLWSVAATCPVFAVPATTTTTLTVTSAGNPATAVAEGTPITLTAAVVSSSASVLRGTVIFCDTTINGKCTGIGEVGSAQLTANGTAVITIRLGVGVHTLQAAFSGTSSYGASSSSTLSLAITGQVATTTSAGVEYQSTLNTTIEAGVQATGTGLPCPTGTMQMIDESFSNTILATDSLSSCTIVGGDFRLAPQSMTTGSKPFSIAAADFNHDGSPDLVVANSGDGTVSVLLGNGDGTFQPQATYAVGAGPISVVVGDFNNDGNPDLAVANFSANTVSVLLGNADGTFQSQQTYATGGAPNAVVTADFNGDGNLDLAVANNTDGTVSILLGNGDGTFQAQQTFATGNGPASIAVGDFNSDGIADMAVANNTDNTVSILLGVGDGTFAEQVPYATGKNPIAVVASYFNSSGFLSLAVANLSDNTVSFLFGGGDGQFGIGYTQSTFGTPYGLAVGNFLGQGYSDLAVACSDDHYVVVYQSNGYQTNDEGGIDTGVNNIAVTSADFAGNGQPDLAALDNQHGKVNLAVDDLGVSAGVQLSINFDLPGPHTLEAVYSGDSVYTSSTSTPVVISNPAVTTTTTLVSSVNPSNYGNPVTLTATVMPDSGGEASSNGAVVTFMSNKTVLGTGTLLSGMTTLTTTDLQVGASPVQAMFAGNPYFAASSSSGVAVTVRPAALTVTAANATRPYGSPNPALTGTVTGALNGDTFTVTGATTATQTSPLGQYTVVPSASGSHLADYNVTAVNGTLTVIQATPANSLASSANPAWVQSTVTFTATVSATGGTPTGTVIFYDGTTMLGTATLSAGTAAYTTSSLAAGTHSITAAYSGDPDFTTVTSGAVAETIENFTLAPASGSSSVTASAGGQAVYTLVVAPPSGATLAGSITFNVTGLPSGATAAFSPTTVASGSGSTNVKLTVTLPSESAMNQKHKQLRMSLLSVALGLILLPLAGSFRKRNAGLKGVFGLMILAAAMIAGLSGCGGGNSGGGQKSTPPQSYALTVTASSGSLSNSTNVTLVVN